MQIFSIREICGSDVLAGAQPGRRVLGGIIGGLERTEDWDIVVLDFANVIATASALREVVIGLRDYTRKAIPSLFPVVANAESVVIEELEMYLEKIGDAVWCCSLSADGLVEDAHIVGLLDPAERETIDLLLGQATASAPALAQSQAERGLSPNAWNNRLNALADKGLVVARREGKTNTYVALLRTSKNG